jgi:hypothetical protein|tara:strand:- start:903 stop:1061 length:159 start_codon:yes stop_codon:yes gene_type:complete
MKIIAVICFGFFISALGIEFMSGCGQAVYYEDRTWETGPCVFIDYDVRRGTW